MEPRAWHRHYPPGQPRTLDYEPLTVVDFLRRSSERVPERTALLFESARISYARLQREVDRLASAFAALGAGSGTSVAIHLPNLPQAVIAYYAALATGARVVLTNPLYTFPEIEHQWSDAEVALAVTADFLYARVLAPGRTHLPAQSYVIASIPEYLPFPLKLLAPLKLRRMHPPASARIERGPGIHFFRELVARAPRAPRSSLARIDEVAVLQYTGGTTGVAKAAMLSHRNLSANVQQIDACFLGMGFGEEVVLTALPLFHVFGMTVCMNWGLMKGATLVLAPNPRDASGLARAIERHRVTAFPGVPAMYNALNNVKGIERRDLRSVKCCLSGSAPIAPEVLTRFETLTGARILEGFGMSETSPVTHVNPVSGLRKIGTVGIPIPDTDARIVAAEGGAAELATGEAGELLVKGPQVMAGYWKRPDETEKVLVDGWMRTGDLATMDADGFFAIVGRKKDMINASGFKVFPDEVDAVLLAHPAVLEAATIGVPDPDRVETVKSFVVFKPGETAEWAELERFCRERLAPYKVPRAWEALPELPKTSVLKVLRRELREREIARLSDSRAAR